MDEPWRLKLEVDGFRCLRCGWEWIPRDISRPPVVCPNLKCKSPYWQRPRKGEQGPGTKAKGKK